MPKYIKNYNRFLNEEVNTGTSMKQIALDSMKTHFNKLVSTNFTREEGNDFREWANSTPELRQKYGKQSVYDLDSSGLPDNAFIRKAYSAAKKEYVNRKKELQVNLDSGDLVIFSAGLDNRPGDKPLKQQIEMLQNSLGNKNIQGFRYNDKSGFINAIKANPSATVIMFSAGNQWANSAALASQNKSRIYMIEPYNSGSSGGTNKSVNSAVSQGVPSTNVMTGPTSGRGKNILKGTTNTPSGISHWGSLENANLIIK
jgi:hypothetical protein